MKDNMILIYKPIGATPLDIIKRLKEHKPELAQEKISYAGRLDPMAEGLMILLIGEENKKRKEYEALSKTYVVKIFVGISTDTYDLLGEITRVKTPQLADTEYCVKKLRSLQGKRSMQYPPYSSKTVNGKPLYYWARKKLLQTIIIPEKNIEIFSIQIVSITNISGKDVAHQAITKIQLVNGDFRQAEILQIWEEFGKMNSQQNYALVEVEISCSSGTYMRKIASMIGEERDIPTLAFSIMRKKVGNNTIDGALILDDLASVK
jgi:tRNA pseudouridine(55) synthase